MKPQRPKQYIKNTWIELLANVGGNDLEAVFFSYRKTCSNILCGATHA